MKTKSRTSSRSSSSSRSARKIKPSRNVIVTAILLGSLSLTGMLLVVMAPSPLIPDPAWTLIGIDSIDKAFLTRVPIRQNQWTTIYIRHTRTRSGNAVSIGQETGGLGDHFLIGNGYGCPDGELQVGQRWSDQQPSRTGAARDWITICLVGDFDQTTPTDRQMAMLTELIATLQQRLGIRTENVVVYDRPDSAGIGRNFPIQRLAKGLQG